MNSTPARILLLAFTLTLSSCSRAPKMEVVIDTDEFADLQQVQIYRPDDRAAKTTLAVNGIALLLGTDADWRSGSTRIATKLAADGWLVAGIHTDRFISARKAQDADCLELVTLLDVFSQHLQQRYHITEYQRPLLVGYREAGSIAYLALAQADAGIFRGAVSLGISSHVASPLPFCAHDGALTKNTSNVSQQILPMPRVAARWSVWTRSRHDPAMQNLLQTMTAAKVHDKTVSHDDDVDDWLPVALEEISPKDNTSLADLPLVEMPAKSSHANYFAIILSGDGGWANIDRDIGNTLNARGINVVGWNSLQYFWNRRTPEAAAGDLSRVMQHYGKIWQKPRVLLIGYSLGADVLPFMLSRIPERDARTLASIALLSASKSVDFEFHVSNWLDTGNSQERQTAPELKKISTLPVQCLYGSDDDDSVCRGLKAPQNWHITELPGDHHFNGNYEKVTALILANMPPASPL
jgi:type IV secretory pathway VirJ component